jgi:hypothetical protein
VSWVHTETLGTILDGDPLLLHARRPAATRIQQPDPGSDQLLKILVAGHDHDVRLPVHRLTRQRADHIVGFVARERQDGDPIRIEELADALHPRVEVGLELLRQFLARCLVVGIPLVAEAEPRIMNPAEILGLMRGEQALEKVDDAPRGRRVLSARRGERASDEREERAVDERVAVDEEQARCARRCRGWRSGEGRISHGRLGERPGRDLQSLLPTSYPAVTPASTARTRTSSVPKTAPPAT